MIDDLDGSLGSGNYLMILPTDVAPHFLKKLAPLFNFKVTNQSNDVHRICVTKGNAYSGNEIADGNKPVDQSQNTSSEGAKSFARSLSLISDGLLAKLF